MKPVRDIVFPWQPGDAFTIPWFGSILIAYRERAMLTASDWAYLRIHEGVHVQQIRDMGSLKYLLLVVLWARLRYGIPEATCSPWELQAYRAAGQTKEIAKCR